MTDRSEANRVNDELVERVARVICCTNGQCYRPEKCFSWTFTGEARAAIAVVLKEAAKVIEHDCHDDMTRDEEAADEITALRAEVEWYKEHSARVQEVTATYTRTIMQYRAENERLRAALEQIAGYRMKGKSDADIARAAITQEVRDD